jgi:hypothetical protein
MSIFKTGFSRRLSVVLLACLTTSGYAEVYKWVDANGHIQYSDQPPPPDTKKQAVTIHSSSGLGTPAIEKKADDKKTPGATAKSAEDKELAAKNCDIATKNLEGMQHAQLVHGKNDKGETTDYSGPELADLRKKTQEDRDHWCQAAQ